jgi:hypothetical protein
MTESTPARADAARGRGPMPLSQQRFWLALALLLALMACLWGAVTFRISEAIYSGLAVVVGATIVPAVKRAFEYFFPARGAEDAPRG